MTLFEYYLQYMTRICEGSLEAPEGITLTETDEVRRAMELQQQVGAMGIPAFVRACAAAAGDEIPREAYDNFSMDDALSAARALTEQAREEPKEPEQKEPDPDAGKHAFEVFLDCIALDDGLVQYLIEVLKKKDWQEFYKLSRITTKLDLDPNEFLYWLGNKEQYAPGRSRCARRSWTRAWPGWRRKSGWMWRRHCSRVTGKPLSCSAARPRSCCIYRRPPLTGTAGTTWTGTIPCG